VFGRKQKAQQAKRLADACATARDHIAGDDVVALTSSRAELIQAWRGASSENASEVFHLITEAERRIDVLKRQYFEQSLKPCRHCEGREFRISTERQLEHFGKLRLVVCVSCGLTQVFWADLATLESSGMFSQAFQVAPGAGPFR
jgi:hypothetical protein